MYQLSSAIEGSVACNYLHAGLQAKEGLYHSRGSNVLHHQKHVESHL